MIMLLQKLLRLTNGKAIRSHFSKAICTSARLNAGAYDGIGQSYVDILDAQRHPEIGLIIASFSQVGFRLSNGIYCVGPIVMFSRSVLSWDVGGAYDITPESLSLFTRLEPKLDILVLGIGDSIDWRKMVEKQIYVDIIKKSGINVEIETTEHACSTYNILCTEHRLVAGAFIPPLTLNTNDADVINTKLRFDAIYDDKEEKSLEAAGWEKDCEKRLESEAKKQLDEINKEWYIRRAKIEPYADGNEGVDKEESEMFQPPQSYYEKIEEKEKEELKRIGEKEEERKRVETGKDKEGFKYVGGGKTGKGTDSHQKINDKGFKHGKETKKEEDMIILDVFKDEPVPDREAENKKNEELERKADRELKEINREFNAKRGSFDVYGADTEYSQLNSPPKSYYEQIAEKEEEERKKMAGKKEESNKSEEDDNKIKFQYVKPKKAKKAKRESEEQKDKKDDS